VPIADANLTVALVAAAAAILSAGGSIAAAVVAWRLGVERFKHEREQADRSDGREVLAAGALALGQAKGTMKDALTLYEKGLNSGKPEDWPLKDEFYAQLRELEAAKEKLESALAAVRIRFKQTADVVTELAGAVEKLGSVIPVHWLAHQGRGAEEGDGGDLTEAMSLSTEWDEHRDNYLAAAQVAVGSEL
jgi:hypothetical protein